MVGRSPREAGADDIAVEVLDHAVAVRPTGEIDIEAAGRPPSERIPGRTPSVGGCSEPV
ncbi:hypothetical protein ACE1OC_07345 [Streptomyces sp. DSM 116496]|uniref:hypothetical protein n=1 Tax=Streptomyces stoeckheimensis TaxID=3344656 RepID=UPI0038B3696E